MERKHSTKNPKAKTIKPKKIATRQASTAIAKFLSNPPHTESSAETTKEIQVKLGIGERKVHELLHALAEQGALRVVRKQIKYLNGVIHPVDAYYVVD